MSRKRIVYSTDKGRICPECSRVSDQCVCRAKPSEIEHLDGVVRLQRQVKGRAGKPVIVITGLALDPAALKTIARALKSKCGVGGSIEKNNILIQGDKRDLIKTELELRGYTVKLSGG